MECYIIQYSSTSIFPTLSLVFALTLLFATAVKENPRCVPQDNENENVYGAGSLSQKPA